MKQYISDIITSKEIERWLPGNTILIESQTGSGKSQFVKDVLYDFCKAHNKRILLLSNRNVLRNQNEEELGEDKSDIITLRNYQSLEVGFINGFSIEELFADFDYICYDECHYLLSDSTFNSKTDILLDQVKHPQNKVYIFISATVDAILTYHNDFTFKYNIPSDYGYIENLYFYSKGETLNNILEKIPAEEKVIYFGTALESLELSLNFGDSAFTCSENNQEFFRRSSKQTTKDIEKDNRFKSRMLFTTKVIDNGINIIDPSIKHIIIDLFDPIDVIQCLGRKRIEDGEKINLYIKNYHGGEIYPRIQNIDKKLKWVDEINELGKEEFQRKHSRSIIDPIIQNDLEINQAKLYYYRYLKNLSAHMLSDDNGYKKYICHRLGFNFDNIKIAEEYYEKESLADILEAYINKRIYTGQEQEAFKEKFFNKLFIPKRKLDYRNRGFNSINSILQEDRLPYYITSMKDNSGIHRNKRFWLVNKIDIEQSF